MWIKVKHQDENMYSKWYWNLNKHILSKEFFKVDYIEKGEEFTTYYVKELPMQYFWTVNNPKDEFRGNVLKIYQTRLEKI